MATHLHRSIQCPKAFDFGSINGCQNSLHLSKKLGIIIGMETSEFIV
jgi:hypothetical protein